MYAYSATPPEISINTTRRSATSGDRHPSFILEITSVYFLSVLLFTPILLPRILVLSMIIIASDGRSIYVCETFYHPLFRRSFLTIFLMVISLMMIVKLTTLTRKEIERIYSNYDLPDCRFVYFISF